MNQDFLVKFGNGLPAGFNHYTATQNEYNELKSLQNFLWELLAASSFPEPRDTSSTPNFDAYAKGIKDIFNQHTRSSTTVQIAQNKRLASTSSEEDENWWCILL